MTRSTHLSDTTRFWSPTALAFAAGAAGVAATFGSVMTASASPALPTPDTAASVSAPAEPRPAQAPCFGGRLHWSAALDGSTPTCVRFATASFASTIGTASTSRDTGANVAVGAANHIRQIRWLTQP